MTSLVLQSYKEQADKGACANAGVLMERKDTSDTCHYARAEVWSENTKHHAHESKSSMIMSESELLSPQQQLQQVISLPIAICHVACMLSPVLLPQQLFFGFHSLRI